MTLLEPDDVIKYKWMAAKIVGTHYSLSINVAKYEANIVVVCLLDWPVLLVDSKKDV